jgi:hypothetical protein
MQKIQEMNNKKLQKKKLENELVKKINDYTQKIDNLNPKLQNAQEVFLMASNVEETQDVLSLNSQESLRKLQQRSSYLEKEGTATDSQLPDIKMDLRARSTEMARQHRRK